MFKDRYTVGNVCLVVFLAFIFSALTATVKVPLASAKLAQPVTMIPPTSTTNKYDPATRKVTLQVQLNPVTPLDFSTLQYYVSLLGEDGSSILSSQEFTYKRAIQAVYETAYGKLLELEYTSPTGIHLAPTFTVVYRSVYAGPGPLTVYLELTYKPPAAPTGGGGGTSAPSVVATCVGDLTLTTDKAALIVDGGKFLTAMGNLPAGQAYVLPISVLSIRPVMEYSLPASLLGTCGSRLIQFPADGVSLTASMDMVPAQKSGAAGASLRITISRASASDAAVGFGEIFGSGASVDFSPAAPGYKVEMAWASGSTTEAVSWGTVPPRPFKMTMKYDAAKMQNPERLVGVHKDSSGSFRPVTRTVIRPDALEADLYTDRLSWFSVAQWRKDFTDTAAHWACLDILAMAARGVAKGMVDGSFAPDAILTRAQFAALLTRTLDKSATAPAQGKFKDVQPWAWYYGAVEAAAGAGLVKGYEDGTFKPDASISRQEMAAMVMRAMGLLVKTASLDSATVEATLSGFGDAQAIGAWAREPVAQAVRTGIASGRTITTFQPAAGSTRAESVVMLRRLLKAAGYIQ